MPEERFWRLTLAQLNTLLERYLSEQENLDFRAALVCSIIAEVNRDTKKRKKAYTPMDFMPQRRKAGEISESQMLNRVKNINTVLGGEVK